MAYVNVTIRMDKDEKDRAEKLFSEFGLTMNAAFNMFAKQALREESIPFRIAKNSGIQYLDRKNLDKMLEESERDHRKVYEELAK
ncbi:MAG TPA: type II toxin-antitoxin system antitoxin, RelB/DinJ family [Firmicutes bacterium]|nr:type II toxin-antitoxin system antitoxin, RelB/DinJ family [Bacillota bacterium]